MNNFKYIGLDFSQSQILSLKRKKLLLWTFTILCVFTLVPLAFNHYLLGNHYLAFALMAFFVCLLIDAISVQVNNMFIIHPSLVAFCLVVSLLISIYHLGVAAVFWFYPIVMILTFVLSKNSSCFFNVVLLAGLAVIGSSQMQLELMLRAIISLAITWLLAFLLMKGMNNLAEKLRQASTEDPLTKVLNRRQLNRTLEDAIALKKRHDITSTLMIFDIDHFKKINDHYGHSVGDNVIINVCNLIKSITRKEDILFRLGGDEFLLLMNYSNVNEAEYLAQKVCNAMATIDLAIPVKITVSIGLCEISTDLAVQDWIDAADRALYEAKASGRNCVKKQTELPSLSLH
jgi:diguanylate cyclase (GGDEF)-like protein